MPGIVGEPMMLPPDKRPKPTFIPRLGSKSKDSDSIGEKNKQPKTKGTKTIEFMPDPTKLY